MDYGYNTNNSNPGYQYGNTNGQPGRPPEEREFAIASMVCGIIAIVFCCTGVFPIVLGSLSILFAILSHHKGNQMHSMSITGIVLSCVGILLGLMILTMSFIDTAANKKENSRSRQSMGDAFEENYNEDMESFLKKYGITME